MLTSQHHVTLEEIGRLEAERKRIDEKIRVLRASLPKPEKQAVNTSTGLAPAQEAPIAALVAQNPVEPTITDHAVLRYLERHYGFDFESVRKGLLSEAVRLAMKMGARSVKADGGKLMIVGNKVVTFSPNNRSQKVRAGKPKRVRNFDD